MIPGAEYFYKIGHRLEDEVVDAFARDMKKQAQGWGPVDPELRLCNSDMTAFSDSKREERDGYVERVRELLEAGRGIAGVAKEIDRSQNYVRRIMKENDLFKLRKPYDPTDNLYQDKLRDNREEARKVVIPLMLEGLSQRQIADQTGHSVFLINRIIQEYNNR